jgi:hypothetical protein
VLGARGELRARVFGAVSAPGRSITSKLARSPRLKKGRFAREISNAAGARADVAASRLGVLDELRDEDRLSATSTPPTSTRLRKFDMAET